jgi:hypothetical protein
VEGGARNWKERGEEKGKEKRGGGRRCCSKGLGVRLIAVLGWQTERDVSACKAEEIDRSMVVTTVPL